MRLECGRGRVRLGIPNLTVQEFVNDFIPRAYDDVYGIDSRVHDIANGLYDFHLLPCSGIADVVIML